VRSRLPLVVAVLVGLLAIAGGMLLARRSGGYAPTRTASGQVTVAGAAAPAAGASPTAGALAAGTHPAAYCASYANVARQTGYVYQAQVGDAVLFLADSLDRAGGAQDAARVTLAVTRGAERWAWRPGAGGSVTLAEDLLRAEVDAPLVRGAGTAAGDTLRVRATFACTPRVDPRKRRR
jgi:hypothetical protein